MKLFYCPICQDLLKMSTPYSCDTGYCDCASSWGCYTGPLQAEYGGKAVPIGIDNSSFVEAMQAIRKRDKSLTMGQTFVAFIIPENCDTCKRVGGEGK